ncbi:(S)-benzoin forming benzil reductase [Paenibacillus sediminis]|uniref:Benzil reductase ((S)-benzoin forming) n=1 Tax=Paenibacillus sediminis TaxID=664909 RepID=A0ABS4H1X7_9BACL|nr:(S)-benzoin forming benzil reductase [Paenibacillus sediminis]MBP1936518.1 benzil reductase ((S)-benzoin forming) [Paenibacillus sediminis]
MNYYIVTGTSQGLGEAIARQLLSKGNHVFCISRSENKDLMEAAQGEGVELEYYNFDLSNVDRIDALMNNIFGKISKEYIESIALINNAGVVTPMKPIELCNSEEIIQNIQVNLTAPMLLTSAFVSHLDHVKADKRVINISSGAGKKPYFGWSNYCSAKAGIDMFTRTVALEQEHKEYPVKIISFAPGVVDTAMQGKIRKSSKDNFKDLDRFIKMKDDGALYTPQYVAEYVLQLLTQDLVGGEILDIRNM